MLSSHGHPARRTESSPRFRRFAAAGALLFTALPAHAQGPLVAWGDDTHGLVSGIPAGRFVAVSVATTDQWEASRHAVAIRTDGTLVSWGDDSFGQVSGTPAGTFTDAAAGSAHTVALRTDGTITSWGGDWAGQVGGTPAGTFSAVAAGAYHSVAIRTDGTLITWGAQPSYEWRYGPAPAGTYTDVASGITNNVAIRTDGTLAIWGSDELSDVYPAPPGTFSRVAVQAFSMVGIRTDGSLVEWASGQTNWGTPAGSFSDVASGYLHNVALRTDGTLASWGLDAFAEVSATPAGTFSSVAAGGFTSIAIADSGNQPPVITCHDPVVLWSPNHELVDAGSAFSINDPDGDPVNVSLRVFSDETEIPDTGDGTGRHAPDFKTQLASGTQGLFLRNERRSAEDGRFYLGLITADDGMGGVTEQVCILAVCPRDQSRSASLEDVLNQAAAAAGATGFPAGLNEHGQSAPLGPHQ